MIIMIAMSSPPESPVPARTAGHEELKLPVAWIVYWSVSPENGSDFPSNNKSDTQPSKPEKYKIKYFGWPPIIFSKNTTINECII